MFTQETRTVNYSGKVLTASVVVCEETALVQLRRARLEREGRELAVAEGMTDPDLIAMRVFVYPCMIAATQSGKLWAGMGDEDGPSVPLPWPIPFELFVALPAAFYAEWSQAVSDLIPQWFDKPILTEAEIEDARKKVTGSTAT